MIVIDNDGMRSGTWMAFSDAVEIVGDGNLHHPDDIEAREMAQIDAVLNAERWGYEDGYDAGLLAARTKAGRARIAELRAEMDA